MLGHAMLRRLVRERAAVEAGLPDFGPSQEQCILEKCYCPRIGNGHGASPGRCGRANLYEPV